MLSLEALPEPGWVFLRWEGTVTSTNDPLELLMDQDHQVQVIFGTQVRKVIAGYGSIVLDPPEPIPYGATVQATAVPAPGCWFVGWTGIGAGQPNPFSFTVTNALPLLGAVFTGVPYPVIVQQPTNQTVLLGQSVLLSVVVAGAEPFSYQWRKEGEPIPNATSASYLIASVSLADAGRYDVVVSNPYGSVTSAVAVLTVVEPPFISTQPVSQTVPVGSRLSLSVEAGGTEPLSYQWWAGSEPMAGAQQASLVFDPVQLEHSGSYWVVVANPWGAVTSAVAVVTVYEPVSLRQGAVQQAVSYGGTARFSVEASGYPEPMYQWLFEGEPLAGATNSSLVLTNVGTNALDQYAVVVWNASSALTSAPVQLVMLPSLVAPFSGATVLWGREVTLSVGAVGSGPLSYQWYKDGQPLAGATNATLVLAQAQVSDAGWYAVVVSSPWGSVTNAPAQLVVNPANIGLGLYPGLTIEGMPGYTYEIQYSTDLRQTNGWMTATNLTLEAPVQLWIDTSVNVRAPGAPQRYYRVVGRE